MKMFYNEKAIWSAKSMILGLTLIVSNNFWSISELLCQENLGVEDYNYLLVFEFVRKICFVISFCYVYEFSQNCCPPFYQIIFLLMEVLWVQ